MHAGFYLGRQNLHLDVSQACLASTPLKFDFAGSNMYSRQLPSYQLALNILLCYIGLGYATIIVVYYAAVCRPFRQYWAMPVKDLQCSTYQHYSIVQMV